MRRILFDRIINPFPVIPLPSNIITVGPDKCNYTSLVTALQNANEGDNFIIYGGVHDGKFIFKNNQSFFCVGRVELKNSADDFLFQYASPLNPPPGTIIHETFWSGSLPFLNPKNFYKWCQFPSNNAPLANWAGIVRMHGLYVFRNFQVSQSGTNAPVVAFEFPGPGRYTNVLNNASWANVTPTRYDVGIYEIGAGLDLPIAHQDYEYSIVPYYTSLIRHLIWGGNTDSFSLDIECYDVTGNPVDGFQIIVHVKIPFTLNFP